MQHAPAQQKADFLILSNQTVISIQQCKEILDSSDLTEEQIIEIRDMLYALVGQLYDEFEAVHVADIQEKSRHYKEVKNN